MTLTNDISVATYNYQEYYSKNDTTVPKEQDWLISYCQQNQGGQSLDSPPSILIHPEISNTSIGRDSNISVNAIVNQFNEQRKLLEPAELIPLLELIVNRKPGNTTVADFLFKLAREYKAKNHIIQAICCYIAIKSIEGLSQHEYEKLTAETIFCCQEFAKGLQHGALLHKFLSLKNVRIVSFLLDNKETFQIEINEFLGFRNQTALNVACEIGCVEIVDLLFERGADIIAHSHRETCLYVACQVGHEEVVDKLLQHPRIGQIIDLPNRSKECLDTALHIAVKNGYVSIANKLIGAGADIKLPNQSRNLIGTVLGELVCTDNCEDTQAQDDLACLLMQKHCYLNQDFNEEPWLIDGLLEGAVKNGLYNFFINHLTSYINNKNILRFIKIAYNQMRGQLYGQSKNVHKQQSCKKILLYILSDSKNFHIEDSEIFKQLSGYSCNLLCVAAKHGEIDVVACILHQYPVELVKVFSDGRTVFHFAAENDKDDVRMVELIFSKMPELINILGEYYNETVLHRSIEERNVKVTEFLLKKGASPNARTQNREGNTPLILAARRCYDTLSPLEVKKCAKICKLLIEYEADITLTDNMGKTALQIQESMYGGGHEELLQLLKPTPTSSCSENKIIN